jgi:drug/metabolite transporter (DMT)-like permease
LLLVAVCSISSSAVLVRYAAASSVALAFWRCLGGSLILGVGAFRSGTRVAVAGASLPLMAVAGVALGLHFATWLASLEMTSTAASVTLVSTAPVFVVLGNRLTGRRPSRQVVVAVGVAICGGLILTGGDLVSDPGSFDGDLMALAGAVFMAVYLIVGQHLRGRMGTAGYAAGVYAIAALTMVPLALVADIGLIGFDRSTWLAIGGMVLGPQLGGHTVLNLLLGRIGSVLVSLSLLTEPIVASIATWIIFEEVPPATALWGSPIVLFGLALAIRASRSDRGGRPVPVGP